MVRNILPSFFFIFGNSTCFRNKKNHMACRTQLQQSERRKKNRALHIRQREEEEKNEKQRMCDRQRDRERNILRVRNVWCTIRSVSVARYNGRQRQWCVSLRRSVTYVVDLRRSTRNTYGLRSINTSQRGLQPLVHVRVCVSLLVCIGVGSGVRVSLSLYSQLSVLYSAYTTYSFFYIYNVWRLHLEAGNVPYTFQYQFGGGGVRSRKYK